jgi:hypothetical protein
MVSWQNRTAQDSPVAGYLFVFMTGILLLMAAIFLTEHSVPNAQHSGRFYADSASTYPLYLVAAARASKLRWPATITAAVYMLIVMLMIWILPLFAGEPRLAPIYNPVDHFVPPAFPLLLIVPAVAIDLVTQRFGRKPGWFRNTLVAIALGVLFVSLFLPTQWFFSKFLISPSADNWFFAGGHFFPYTSSGTWKNHFWQLNEDPLTLRRILIVTVWAVVMSRLALGFGSWMAKVRR